MGTLLWLRKPRQHIAHSAAPLTASLYTMIGLTDSADVATARIMMGPFSCLPCACLPGAASAAAIAGAAAEAAAAAAGELGLHRCSAAGLTKRRCTVAMAHSVRSMTKNMQPTNTCVAAEQRTSLVLSRLFRQKSLHCLRVDVPSLKPAYAPGVPSSQTPPPPAAPPA